MSNYKAKSLETLPPEIISSIASYSTSAATLRNLSFTSSTLHGIVEANGWSAFVTNRFSSIKVPPYWRDAAHSLTTLSRAFDRKAFIVQDAGPEHGHEGIKPESHTPRQRSQRQRSQLQTMGYQPVVDSYEVFTGNSWNSRQEIVSWGAGCEVILKTVHSASHLSQAERDSAEQFHSPRRPLLNQEHPGKPMFQTYRDPQCRDGIDDITALSILKSEDGDAENVDMVVGRASGGLQHLQLSRKSTTVITTFNTASCSLRSAGILQGPEPLLAACLGNSQVTLFKVKDTAKNEQSASTTTCGADDNSTRSWSSVFIGRNRLAIGRGMSTNIVHVFNVAEYGLSKTPLRSFSSLTGNEVVAKRTSCYPIVSVPQSSHSIDCDGDLFFSGGYDGTIRLHDMRSPRDCVSTLSDPIDSSAIYSMAMVGREIVIAGSSSHGLVKVFDLKMAGGRLYDQLEVSQRLGETRETDDIKHSGWNIFTLSTGPSIRPQQGRRTWSSSSPIYSLSRPSPSSTSLYVGREDQVLHFNFTSSSDQHPDPRFRENVVRDESGRIAAGKTWDPFGRVMNVSFYEQEGPSRTQLKYQRSIIDTALLSPPQLAAQPSGLDARWHDIDNARAEVIVSQFRRS